MILDLFARFKSLIDVYICNVETLNLLNFKLVPCNQFKFFDVNSEQQRSALSTPGAGQYTHRSSRAGIIILGIASI
jgi:hypothetical protein